MTTPASHPTCAGGPLTVVHVARIRHTAGTAGSVRLWELADSLDAVDGTYTFDLLSVRFCTATLRNRFVEAVRSHPLADRVADIETERVDR